MIFPEGITKQFLHEAAHISGMTQYVGEDNKFLERFAVAVANKAAEAPAKERDHWKANHENQVKRARILMERPDMPIERVNAYKHYSEMAANEQALKEKIAFLEEQFNQISAIVDRMFKEESDGIR